MKKILQYYSVKKVHIFLFHHINKTLISFTIIFLIGTSFYHFSWINKNEIFRHAYEVGIIANTISLSFVASYIFFFVNKELATFNAKILSYLRIYEHKENIRRTVSMMLKNFKSDEIDWINLNNDEKRLLITNKIKEECQIETLFSASGELNEKAKNVIIEKHFKDCTSSFTLIKNEFETLEKHSSFLPPKLLAISLAIQELQIFRATIGLNQLQQPNGKEDWDLTIFVFEYVNFFDFFILMLQILDKKINPYWELARWHTDFTILK